MPKHKTQIINQLRTASIKDIIRILNELYEKSESADDAVYDNKDLMTVLEHTLDMDGKLEGIVDVRTQELQAWSWELINHGKRDLDTKKIELFLEEPINDLLRVPLQRYLFGQSLVRLTPRRADISGGLIPVDAAIMSDIEFKRYGDGFALWEVEDNDILSAKYTVYDDASAYSFGNNTAYIYTRSGKKHTGGALKQLAKYAFLKHKIGLNDWAETLNKSKGFWTAVYNNIGGALISEIQSLLAVGPTNTNVSEAAFGALRKILDGLRTVQNDDVMALPSSIDVRHVDGSAGGNFESFINAIDKIYEVIILGQAGTTQLGNNGSFAALKVMRQTQDNKIFADMKVAQRVIQKYLNYWWFTNYNERVAELKINFIYDEQEDIASNYNNISYLTNWHHKILRIDKIPKRAEAYDTFYISLKDYCNKLNLQVPASIFSDVSMYVVALGGASQLGEDFATFISAQE